MTDIEINVEQTNEVEVELQEVNPITTSDHAQLTHLDYASSGHTGFASSIQLTQEATTRATNDNTLQDNIDTEESRATAKENEIAEDLEDETTARESADTTLQANIDAEATTRGNADTSLNNSISLRALITESGNKITLEIDNTTYKFKAKLFDKNDNLISTSNEIDLPLETMVVSASYDNVNKKIVLTLKNGTTVDVPVGALVNGLASETYVNTAVSNEATTRATNDTTLQTNITAEKTRAEGVENSLDTRLDTIEADYLTSSDKTTLQSQITENANDIDALESGKVDKVTGKGLSANDFTNEYKSAVDSNSTARHTHDNKNLLDTITSSMLGKIDTNESAINNEITSRTTADTNLQEQITANANDIGELESNKQDVIDSSNKLSSDLVDDTNHTNKFVSSSEKTQIITNANDINAIESKIPSQATAQNQLADKDFVNSSIATNTAYFLGTLDVVSDLGLSYGATTTAIATALDSHTFVSKTNNDYVFVINKDTDNNVIYQRFKYNGSNFLYEYALNNSSFTANQWASINSGATDVLIGKITTNESAIATEITDRQTAVSNEATARESADSELQDSIDEINDSAVMTSGIDSNKVAQIQTNATNIATKQNKVYLSIVNGMLCITYEI